MGDVRLDVTAAVPDMFAPAMIPVHPLNRMAKTEINPIIGELLIV